MPLKKTGLLSPQFKELEKNSNTFFYLDWDFIEKLVLLPLRSVLFFGKILR